MRSDLAASSPLRSVKAHATRAQAYRVARVCALCLWATLAWDLADARAQVDGHASVLFDVVPDISAADGSQRVAELRTRLFAERRQDIGERLVINLAGYFDGLVADREAAGGAGTTKDAIVRPSDLYAEFRGARFDIRAGFSRLVWGRLDEFQPTDVVNPIDLTRFLLEGRSEARLPVALVRGRVFLPGSSTLETVIAPIFRASTFDQLDEDTSPFNLLSSADPERSEPATRWSNLQGGARFAATAGRFDWALSAYRGFRSFPILTFVGQELRETFPRFTMVGGDFETARGPWGFRGEVAAFVEDEVQDPVSVRGVPGRSVEGGIGIDRRASDYRFAANVLISSRPVEGTDASIVGSAERAFVRDTRRLTMFGVYDPGDGTGFVRVIAAVSPRDNVWVEGSAGLFAGSSLDTFGRLTQRDFLYARLKVFF